MSVYFIVSYDVVDPEAYASYPAGVAPILMKHGAELLVADAEVVTLEGDCAAVSAVVKFESEEAAMGFYNDPDYSPFKKIRIDSTKNGTMVMAKQFVPPTEN